MKRLFTTIFLLSYNIVFSQINLDSLINELYNPKKYTLTAPIEYLMEKFQRFESIDKRELYDVYIDSTGKLSSYIDLSVVHKIFDMQGRVIKIVGYNRNGAYSFWDFPPITETIYKTDTIIQTNYNYKYMFSSRKTTITDKKGRIIITIWEDKETQNFDRTINQFNDSINELTIMHFDINNNLKQDNDGVVFIYKKFDPIKKNEIVEQRFLDINHKLVDAKHHFSNVDCVFSIICRKFDKTEFVTSYYNSAGIKNCEEYDSMPGIFIMGH